MLLVIDLAGHCNINSMEVCQMGGFNWYVNTLHIKNTINFFMSPPGLV